jgi:heme/copper-type cytochrome/quinol oxidase subunit 3
MSDRASAVPAKVATGVPTGRLGVWWFLAGEVVIFGGLIASYILLRLHHPEWAEDAAHTSWIVGGVNTLVLLTSSLTMVMAFQAITEKKPGRAVGLLGLTWLLGLTFLVIKAFEYTHEIQGGYTILAGLFWSFYYLMTGLHALHVIGGLVAIAVVMVGVRRGRDEQRVEYVGLYWHLVDIVWIFLYPLLYIAS